MSNSNIWTIVIVAVIVAAVVSLATLSITGNIVRVATYSRGPPVYNTSEIDAKFKNVNAGVLNMLNNCTVAADYAFYNMTNLQPISCNDVCTSIKKKCVGSALGEMTASAVLPNGSGTLYSLYKYIYYNCAAKTSPIATIKYCTCC